MKAFYAGSFDPFTIGHLSIARRALNMFGSLVIGIGYNEKKPSGSPIGKRIKQIEEVFSDLEGVTVLAYDNLTVDVAREAGCGVLVRGVRDANDFCKEKELADINLEVFGMPTVFIPAEPGLSYVSSSMVRELTHFGYDPEEFIAKKHTTKGN